MNGFNDEDMANRYDLGFEDGKLSAEKEIEQLRAENERLRAAMGDSDDAILIDWLEAHPDYRVCGVWEQDSDGERTLWWYVIHFPTGRSITHPYGTWREAVRIAIAARKKGGNQDDI